MCHRSNWRNTCITHHDIANCMAVLHDSDIDNDNDHSKLMVLQLHGNCIRMVHQMDTIWGQCAWNGIQLITPNFHSDGKIIIKYEVWIILRIRRLSLQW